MDSQNQSGYYAVAIYGLDTDNRVFFQQAETPQEAIKLALMEYAEEENHNLVDYQDWIAELNSTATVEDYINHLLQGDLIVSSPLKCKCSCKL
jgi:hypothetical protein